MTEFAWPPDAVEQLRALRAKGLTFGQIAKCMGRGLTRNAVIGKAKRLQLPRLDTVGPPKPTRPVVVTEKSEPKPKPMPEMKPVEPNPTRLADAPPDQCRWILDGYAQPTVCGAPGYPWCPVHRARVYPQQSRKELAA